MPWEKKGPRVGTQLLVEPATRDRARALAVVAECSVADVWREAIDLTGQELAESKRLAELDRLLHTLKVDQTAALEWMIRKSLNLADLKGSPELQQALVRAVDGAGEAA
jgi:hypothetical protein